MSSLDRPRFSRIATLLTATALFVAPAAVAPSALAATTPTPTPSATASEAAVVSASVGSCADGVLQPNQDLVLTVSVRNGTTESIADAEVEVSLDADTLDDRTELNDWLDGTDNAGGTTVAQIGDVRLLPTSTAQLSSSVPASAIPFATDIEAGTHALEVTVSSGSEVLTTARTTIEWLPGAADGSTGVAIAVPLTLPAATGGLISAEELTEATDVTGSLTRQLDSLWGRPVAIGIDPRILASIRILGDSAPETALQWLARLETAPNETFALQYGDADISAQAQAGAATLLTPTSFDYGVDDSLFATPAATPSGTATSTDEATPIPSEPVAPEPGAPPARPTLESLLAFDYSFPGVGWAPADTLTMDDLATYASSGIYTSIVSSDNLVLPGGAVAATMAEVGGTTLLIDDSALTEAFDDAVAAGTDAEWRAAITRFTAQMAQVQRSGNVPTVAIAASRASVVDGNRLAQTLDAIATLPWAAPAALSTAMAAPRTTDVTVTDSAESAARIDAAGRLNDMAGRIEQFASVLDEPSLLIGTQRNEMLTLLAVSWIEDPDGWDAAVDAGLEAARNRLHSVRIEATSSLLQVSRDSSIPVYVRNDLPWPVTVELQASTSNAVLDIDEGAIDPAAVEAKSQARVSIPVKARVGNGETTLRLQLFSATGVPIDDTARVQTSVRADWETVGTLIVGIVLVLVFGIGIVRSIRKRRRGEPDDEPDPNAELEVQPELDGSIRERRGEEPRG